MDRIKISNSYLMPMRQASLSRTIRYITILLLEHMGNEIKFPQTAEEQALLSKNWVSIYGR